jgi:hypothetical protein
MVLLLLTRYPLLSLLAFYEKCGYEKRGIEMVITVTVASL